VNPGATERKDDPAEPSNANHLQIDHTNKAACAGVQIPSGKSDDMPEVDPRIFGLQSASGGPEVECRAGLFGSDLVPIERYGNRGSPPAANRVGRRDGLAKCVAEPVGKNPALTLALRIST